MSVRPARKCEYYADVCTHSLLALQIIFSVFCEPSLGNVGIACKWEVQGGFYRHGRRCRGIIFRHHKIRSMTRYWKRKRLEQLLFSAEVSGCTRGFFPSQRWNFILRAFIAAIYLVLFNLLWAQNERVARSAKTCQLCLNRTERDIISTLNLKLPVCFFVCVFKSFGWNS